MQCQEAEQIENFIKNKSSKIKIKSKKTGTAKVIMIDLSVAIIAHFPFSDKTISHYSKNWRHLIDVPHHHSPLAL